MLKRRRGSPRCSGPERRHADLLTFLVLGFATVAAPAAAPENDPVAAVRQILHAAVADPCADSPELGSRREALKRAAEALDRPSDLADVLLLPDWRDDDAGEAIASSDRAARRLVADRFEASLRAVFQRGNAAAQLAAADLILDVVARLKPGAAGGWTPRGLGPELAEMSRASENALRVAGARALGLVHADPAVAVPALRALLQDADITPRRAAAGALVDVMATLSRASRNPRGPRPSLDEVIGAGRAVVRAAARGLSDTDPAVRWACVRALAETAAATDAALGAPRTAADSAAGLASVDDVAAVAPLARDLKELTSGLTQALNDPEPGLRLLARRTLEQFASLQQRFEGAGPSVVQARHEGAETPPRPLLERVRASVPALAAGVSDPDVRARRAAIDALENLGEDAAPAAPALLQALADPDPFVRWSAARTLGRLHRVDGAKVVAGLTVLLGDRDLDVRLAAAAALERRGPEAADAMPALARAAAAGDPVLRVAAIEALGGIGSAAKPAVPVLAEALSAPDARVRKAAAEVLGELGDPGEYLEVLRSASADPDPTVRKAVRDALLATGPRKPAGTETAATPAGTQPPPPAEEVVHVSAAQEKDKGPGTSNPDPAVAPPQPAAPVQATGHVPLPLSPATVTPPAPPAGADSSAPPSVAAPLPVAKPDVAAWDGAEAPAGDAHRSEPPAAPPPGYTVPAGGAWGPPAQAGSNIPVAPPTPTAGNTPPAPAPPPPAAAGPAAARPREPIAIASPAPALKSPPAAPTGPASSLWRPTPPGQVIATSADSPRSPASPP